MRPVAWAIFTAVAIWTGYGAQTEGRKNEAMANPVSLKAIFHATDKELRVTYSVRNTGRKDVCVADVVVKAGPTGTDVGAGAARIVWDPERIAVPWCKLLPIPSNSRFPAPPSAYAWLLEAGKASERSITFPLPAPLEGAPAGGGAGGKFRLVAGIVAASADLRARAETVDGTPLWRRPKGPALRHQQESAMEEKLPAPVPFVASGVRSSGPGRPARLAAVKTELDALVEIAFIL